MQTKCFDLTNADLKKANAESPETVLGRCHLLLFRLRDFRTACERFLREPVNGCAACTITPRQVRQSVPGDWIYEQDFLMRTDAFHEDYQE